MTLKDLNLADLNALYDILEERQDYAMELSDTNNMDDYIEQCMTRKNLFQDEINERINLIFN